MPVHDFHTKIGDLIKGHFPNSGTLHVWQDKACDPEGGRTIPLYSKPSDASTLIEYCNVDMLIEVGGNAKVIIEIEESNVKPTHIFGKFFASAFSNKYKVNGGDWKSFTQPILFVQIVTLDKTVRTHVKKRQWERICESISSILTCPLHERRWEYKLLDGSKMEFEADDNKGKELVSTIMEYLKL